jgi:hypothetical protein
MSKKIIMQINYKLNILSKGDFADLHSENRISDLSTGGFAFVIDGMYIPFDFDASSTWVNNGIITYESGRGGLLKDFFISEDHRYLIEEEGIAFEDVSAEFLSMASEISEFFVYTECDDEEFSAGDNNDPDNLLEIEILNISFYDENNTEYKVADEVIKKFNEGRV